jgi:hypothetical protein
MSAPFTVNPKTKISVSCNNWFCCTKKKVKTETPNPSLDDTSEKVEVVREKYRRQSHDETATMDYTVEREVTHYRNRSQRKESE